MNFSQSFDGFGLEKDFIPNYKIGEIMMRQNDAFIGDFVLALTLEWNLSALEIDRESILVKDFILALAQLAMNLHAMPHEFKHFVFVKQFAHEFFGIRDN